MVDGDLAADARIDLREQARQLHKRHAAHIRARNEAREIADDAAAERENRRFAVEAVLDDARINLFGDGKRFRTLAGRDGIHDGMQPGFRQQRRDLLTVERADVAVRHEQRLLRIALAAHEINKRCAEFVTDDDVIALRPELDADDAMSFLIHGARPFPANISRCHRRRAAATIRSCRRYNPPPHRAAHVPA